MQDDEDRIPLVDPVEVVDRGPEDDHGNIEYKRVLVGKTEERLERLATQMRYRVEEGGGEAIYVIGIEDDGTPYGITDEEFAETFQNLQTIAQKSNYALTLLSSKIVEENRKMYEVLVREINEHSYSEVRVAVAGSVDCGKSSTLGVLTSGQLDDGRGKARLSVFNFRHEAETGRTSSVAHHILGFSATGEVVNYESVWGKNSWRDIIERSSKIVSFIDLCGHAKYLRTTITGLSSALPDLCLVLVGSNMGVSHITKEHIFLCLTLKIPFAIIITKIDIGKTRPEVYKETEEMIQKILRLPGIRRLSYRVNNQDDVISCAQKMSSLSVTPIFHTSNVTGEGIDLLRQFLNLLPTQKPEVSSGVLYYLDTTFRVQGIGTVLGGYLVKGSIAVNDKLFLGPIGERGTYETIQVRSIHSKRVPKTRVDAGGYVCLGIKRANKQKIRKGSVVVSPDNQRMVRSFVAEINVLQSPTTIRPGYEPVVHIRNVRQTVKLVDILSNLKSDETDVLRAKDIAVVRFEFRYRPEYIAVGSRLIFAEGLIRAVGVIKEIN